MANNTEQELDELQQLQQSRSEQDIAVGTDGQTAKVLPDECLKEVSNIQTTSRSCTPSAFLSTEACSSVVTAAADFHQPKGRSMGSKVLASSNIDYTVSGSIATNIRPTLALNYRNT